MACSMEVANPIHNDNWLEAICTQEGQGTLARLQWDQVVGRAASPSCCM